MNNCVFKDKFISQLSVKEIVEFLNNNSKNKLEIKGIYGSAKSLVYSSAVSTGINVVVMDNKEQAQFFCNDLYSLLDSESVFFFPSSSTYVNNKITTIKESSQKVQRSSAISELNHYLQGQSKFKNITLVAYPASIYEKVLDSDLLKKNILKIKKGDMLSHQFIKETLMEYNFEKVDFVGEPGQFALRGSIIDLFSYSSDKPFRIDFLEMRLRA